MQYTHKQLVNKTTDELIQIKKEVCDALGKVTRAFQETGSKVEHQKKKRFQALLDEVRELIKKRQHI